MKKIMLIMASAMTMFTASFAQESTIGVYAGFATMQFEENMHIDPVGFQAGVQVTTPINIINNLPFSILWGGELNFVADDAKFMSIAVPANLGYDIEFTDDFKLVPYAGFNFRLNLVGKQDDEKFFKEPYDAKRFQLGMNFGANVHYQQWFAGYRFNPDLVDYFGTNDIKNSKTSYHFWTVGMKF